MIKVKVLGSMPLCYANIPSVLRIDGPLPHASVHVLSEIIVGKETAVVIGRNKFSATRELRERAAVLRNLSSSADRSKRVVASPLSAEDRSRGMVTRIVQADRAGLPTELTAAQPKWW